MYLLRGLTPEQEKAADEVARKRVAVFLLPEAIARQRDAFEQIDV